MSKPNRKTKTATHHDGPTPERMAKSDWAVIAAPKLADEDWRDRTAKARVAVNPLMRLHRHGWFDAEGLRALMAYQALVETAGYNKSRSCIDFSQGGISNANPDYVPAFVRARDRLAGINGWLDEDGEAVSSAVLVAEEAPPERRKESKLDMWRKMFEAAWWASGAEIVDGSPFVSRSALLDHVKNKLELTEASARQYIKPSVSDKLIGALIVAEMVAVMDAGFAVICPQTAGLMVMMKKGKK